MRVLFAIAVLGLVMAGNPLHAAGADPVAVENVSIVACAPLDSPDPACRQVQHPTDFTIALADERHAKRKKITQMPWLIGAFQ